MAGSESSIISLLVEHEGSVLIAKHSSRVYKEECLVSFLTPLSDDGIFVNLKTFECYARNFLPWDYQRHAHKLYLNVKGKIIDPPQDEGVDEEKGNATPVKMAIGVKGGFVVPKDACEPEIEYSYRVYVHPEGVSTPLEDERIPKRIAEACTAVIDHRTAQAEDKLKDWESSFAVSKYSEDLYQVENPPKIPPSGWECAVCGEKNNLWLNLSDGYIGCGRKLYGMGGGCINGVEGAGLLHFRETGERFPLVVKLGTITSHSGDVFSYAKDEDDAVIDRYLAKHLTHFGINIQQLEKTEKTTSELEIDQNLNFDWNRVIEDDEALEKISGAGHRGLKNLGNTCYMSSVFQVICSLPEIQAIFNGNYSKLLEKLSHKTSPAEDFMLQFSKMLLGLHIPTLSTGIDGSKEDTSLGVCASTLSLKPVLFRYISTKGHAEFTSSRQQDAEEFLTFFLKKFAGEEVRLRRTLKGFDASPSTRINELLSFSMEERLECLQSNKVKYTTDINHFLSLRIPALPSSSSEELPLTEEAMLDTKRQRLEADRHMQGASATERSRVTLQDCLDAWSQDDIFDAYRSPVTNTVGCASRRLRFETFPRYLIIHIRRFKADVDWTAIKVDSFVDVPDEIDIEYLRGRGAQPDEVSMPVNDECEESAATDTTKAASIQVDPLLLSNLLELGFEEDVSRRACIATGNSSVDECVQWMFSDEATASEGAAAAPPSAAPRGGVHTPAYSVNLFSEDAKSLIYSLGLGDKEILYALKRHAGNTEAALDLLLSNEGLFEDSLSEEAENIEEDEEEEGDGISESVKKFDGKGRYLLFGIITHLGKNANTGHYVCHLKEDNRWLIYNDEKVAVSKNPPQDFGYLYFFRRKDA